MLDYFDKFLAVDFYVLNQLNIRYPKYKNKFLLFTTQFSDINITDPYRLELDEYLQTMNNIKFVTERINLQNL
jgi:hypothetical protein